MLQLQLLNRAGTQGRKFARLAAEGAKSQIKQAWALKGSFCAPSTQTRLHSDMLHYLWIQYAITGGL